MNKSFKRVFIVLSLLATGLTSHAQLITKDGVKNLTTYGRIGVNSMGVSGDDADGMKNKTGY